jgi:cystathionine gamma-lyase/cystathionine beta-lyase/cystathionine gamma-lyase/homocysteine desulfhydrase
MKGDTKSRGFATRAIHAGQAPEPVTGAVAVPIFQTSTYVHEGLGRSKGFDYARTQNPTRTALEQNVASLEGGLRAHAYASGMAAISALLTLVRADERVVLSRNVYGGTYRLLAQVLDRWRVRPVWVDTTDLDAVREALREPTRLVIVESPTNPLMEVTDLRAVAALAHDAGALLAVDNTFLSPYFQRPLELGADLVVHSATKFLNGHSDSIGGVLISSRPEDADWFGFVQKSVGAILSPFDCFLTLRGIKTLAVRMERHERNARAVAALLDGHSKVERVFYPGLPSFPGHDVHRSQASGFGAMIAFEVADLEAARRLLDRLEVWSLAESLGGVESLACHPASMTHASIPKERRKELGVSDRLVRLSVGIEDEADLLADLERGLSAI